MVTLPSWRLDLEREIDLIEEVARVYGYNRFAEYAAGIWRRGARAAVGGEGSAGAANAAGGGIP